MPLTAQYASAPRIRPLRPTAQPAAPMTDHQREEAMQASRETKAEMNREVAAWTKYTLDKVAELAKKYKKDERYFLDMFFGGGIHLVNHHDKVNPFNAFMSIKARENRMDGEDLLKLKALQALHLAEYHGLNETERLAYVEEFMALKVANLELQRPTPRARIQDVSNVIRNIELLLLGLQRRAGVHAMVCIFRNTTTYVMDPQWFFTSAELEPYLPMAVGKQWNTAQVGARLEAFAIAGCDTSKLFKTVQQKVEFYKMSIRNRVNHSLRQITGNSNLQMQYVHFETRIVHQYGVNIVGWTHPTFGNPSELSSSLEPLKKLYDALVSGECKFVKLSEADVDKRKKEYEAKLASGEVEVTERKQRKDAGTKRGANKRTKKRNAVEDDEDDEEEDDTEDEDEDDGDDEEPVPQPAKKPAAKRRRKERQEESQPSTKRMRKTATKPTTSRRRRTASQAVGDSDAE
ncbi:hypothetical protein BDN72DRAFT_906111 [Pluteus cervinus]|uniref:Uncharacterized protein n=1 Tax=Pluteus cervinus TaxID=181527 RepID=A0ACD3A0L7_9AGAR|nr:hypothetical protein BDN72DRAFT_906111 [Pluteus cervinus]